MPQYKIIQVRERDNDYVKKPSYVEQMETVLNEQAEAGYRLHTILSSEMVSHSIRFDGSISPQTTMIFEKRQK